MQIYTNQYSQVPTSVYEERLRKAAPHTSTEACTCDGSCRFDKCEGHVVGCDCDINYLELTRLQYVEPVLGSKIRNILP